MEEEPDEPPPKKRSTCGKCGATEPLPKLNAVCELRTMHGWVGRCVNGVFVRGDHIDSRARMGGRSSVRPVRRKNKDR